MNIVESIGAWGVKTTPNEMAPIRMGKPQSGDIIEFTDVGVYPHIYGKYGRISDIDRWKKGTIHICCELGSAFLFGDGGVEISGGPFESVLPEDLEPTYTFYEADYWNWGDRGPGSGHGVHYSIQRPVFKLVRKPNKEHVIDQETGDSTGIRPLKYFMDKIKQEDMIKIRNGLTNIIYFPSGPDSEPIDLYRYYAMHLFRMRLIDEVNETILYSSWSNKEGRVEELLDLKRSCQEALLFSSRRIKERLSTGIVYGLCQDDLPDHSTDNKIKDVLREQITILQEKIDNANLKG